MRTKSKVAYLRRVRFLTQKEVAAELEMSQQYYCKLEKNPDDFSLGLAKKLKIILGVDHIDDLVGDVI
ncbi:helix-turn-helix transcriptional regulator [Paenibacillus qinlingensis]|uniref:DNA-binding XRE family transcriptional regulator n=1 Tax=Paenibacillus qinlingensis TaxID=1837343 RepID=A0ABU1P6V7_9BACL|nr:helix-turn-helix transcriptional regulator [Paenibacillus qinlingensis]MDR6555496.1 DNA-binding XRE family transcriptional regulator [Paenibacillus qinlingensis]